VDDFTLKKTFIVPVFAQDEGDAIEKADLVYGKENPHSDEYQAWGDTTEVKETTEKTDLAQATQYDACWFSSEDTAKKCFVVAVQEFFTEDETDRSEPILAHIAVFAEKSVDALEKAEAVYGKKNPENNGYEAFGTPVETTDAADLQEATSNEALLAQKSWIVVVDNYTPRQKGSYRIRVSASSEKEASEKAEEFFLKYHPQADADQVEAVETSEVKDKDTFELPDDYEDDNSGDYWDAED
jgi:hypothetical protein